MSESESKPDGEPALVITSDRYGNPLIDVVCQYPVDEGVVCGVHFIGYIRSKYCPEHKQAGRRLCEKRSREAARSLKETAIANGCEFYKVKRCPCCPMRASPTFATAPTCTPSLSRFRLSASRCTTR